MIPVIRGDITSREGAKGAKIFYQRDYRDYTISPRDPRDTWRDYSRKSRNLTKNIRAI